MSIHEWDVSSYQRKFSHSIALCRFDCNDSTTKWRSIGSITEEDNLVLSPDGDILGVVICEGENLYRKTSQVPLIEFFYAPIKCGFYGSLYNHHDIFSVWRRHVKSFKIGLCVDSHQITLHRHGESFHAKHNDGIDLDKPVTEDYQGCTILAKDVMAFKSSLTVFGDSIAFVQDNKIVLKDQAFKPLIAPFLGDKWQIVSL